MSKHAYYLLSYKDALLGQRVLGLQTNRVQARDVKKIAKLWSTDFCVDPRYPARYFEHSLYMSLVGSTPANLYDLYVTIEDTLRDGTGGTMKILDPETTPVIELGTCYFESIELSNPDRFLSTSACHLVITMSSMTKPVIVE